jgi:hypothetical protein
VVYFETFDGNTTSQLDNGTIENVLNAWCYDSEYSVVRATARLLQDFVLDSSMEYGVLGVLGAEFQLYRHIEHL